MMVLNTIRSMILGSLAFGACLFLSFPGAVLARPVVRSIRSAHGQLTNANATRC